MPTCSAAGRPIDRSINPMRITSMPCRCAISGSSRRDIIARRDKEPGLVPVAGGAGASSCARALTNLSGYACGALEPLAEIRKLVLADVADRPVIQPAFAPVPDVEALDRVDLRGASFGARRLRHEQVDDVLPAAIDHRADGAGIDIIEPAADQGKALRGQVDHRRRHVELAVEPRLYGVLIGGNHVGEMPGLQRTQMRRY